MSIGMDGSSLQNEDFSPGAVDFIKQLKRFLILFSWLSLLA